jgi:hypothetical protein
VWPRRSSAGINSGAPPAGINSATTVEERVVFWQKVHERLAQLANRIGPDLDKIIGQISAKIPMPTPDEQQAAAEAQEELRTAKGMGRSDINHCLRLAEMKDIVDRLGWDEAHWHELVNEIVRGANLSRKAMTRRLAKELRAFEAGRIDETVTKLAAKGYDVAPEDVFRMARATTARKGSRGIVVALCRRATGISLPRYRPSRGPTDGADKVSRIIHVGLTSADGAVANVVAAPDVGASPASFLPNFNIVMLSKALWRRPCG